jgi:glutaredoxin
LAELREQRHKPEVIMKKLNALFIVFFLILIITGLAKAEIYKWVDENGVVHITDVPPEDVGQNGKVESTTPFSDVPPENVGPNVKVESITPSKSVPDVNPYPPRKKATLTQKLLDIFLKKPKNRTSPSTSTSPKVELYSTSWCYYCKKAREFFRSRGIPFTEYDIEKDKKAAARKKRLDKRNGVPFAVINGRGIHGFSAAAYERALEGHP